MKASRNLQSSAKYTDGYWWEHTDLLQQFWINANLYSKQERNLMDGIWCKVGDENIFKNVSS